MKFPGRIFRPNTSKQSKIYCSKLSLKRTAFFMPKTLKEVLYGSSQRFQFSGRPPAFGEP